MLNIQQQPFDRSSKTFRHVSNSACRSSSAVTHTEQCHLRSEEYSKACQSHGNEAWTTGRLTFRGNLPTLVPPNFWTTQPLGLSFLTRFFMVASPIDSIVVSEVLLDHRDLNIVLNMDMEACCEANCSGSNVFRLLQVAAVSPPLTQSSGSRDLQGTCLAWTVR